MSTPFVRKERTLQDALYDLGRSIQERKRLEAIKQARRAAYLKKEKRADEEDLAEEWYRKARQLELPFK